MKTACLNTINELIRFTRLNVRKFFRILVFFRILSRCKDFNICEDYVDNIGEMYVKFAQMLKFLYFPIA